MKTSAKKPGRRATDVRFLPAVIGVGAILFALKAGGLAFGARAASEPAAAAPAAQAQPAAAATPAKPPAAAPATPATAAANAAPNALPVAAPAAPQATGPKLPNGAPDPTAAIKSALPNPPGKPTLAETLNPKAPADGLSGDLTGAGVSQAEMDVLTSLSDRRDTLDQRQRELDLRANVISAAEKRVDDKIAQLKGLQATIEALLGQRDQKETQQLDSLVRIYTAMKPKDAARIFGTLDDNVRMGVAGRMKPDAMAGILTSLPPEVAQKMTVELASQYKLPVAAAKAAAAVVPPKPAVPAPAAPAPAAAAPKPPGG
jgi:flagellar motility protein MotE (MotC chaperone)